MFIFKKARFVVFVSFVFLINSLNKVKLFILFDFKNKKIINK